MESNDKSFAKWMKHQENDKNLTEEARAELNKMLEVHGNVEPDRGNLDDPKIEWRCGKPNYALANLAYMMGKTQCHAKGSLEILVENVVKTWEMEASHKVNTAQWGTIIQEKYNVQANGEKIFELEEAFTRGNYNVLMDHVDANLYDAANQDFDSSHHLFRSSLEGSFPWEVSEVFTGPPDIVFSWRHWGEFTGEYERNKGNGQVVEMTGFVLVSVTDELKITDLRVFFKPEDFLRTLKGQESLKKNPALKSSFSFSSWLKLNECKLDDSMFVQKAEEEMKKMILIPDIKRPDRGHPNDSSAFWKSGPPNYTLVDLAFLQGKSFSHGKESLELLVENLVKSCEMEISHKVRSQWRTLSSDGKVQVNGEDISEELEGFIKSRSESSRNAFPWEVTEVFSKPPDFSFTWRHWMELGGSKDGDESTIIEIKGFALIKLNEKSEIKSFRVYFKPNDEFNVHLEGMGKCPFASLGKKKV